MGALWRSSKRPDHFRAFRADAAREVLWAGTGSEGYLQASPDVRYVGVLGPDSGGKTLKHQSTYIPAGISDSPRANRLPATCR
jgi:hypothetical protein